MLRVNLQTTMVFLFTACVGFQAVKLFLLCFIKSSYFEYVCMLKYFIHTMAHGLPLYFEEKGITVFIFRN